MILKSTEQLSESGISSFQKSLDVVLSDKSPSTFHKITEDRAAFAKAEELSQQLKANYTHFVMIGVGGSSMGARAIAEMAVTENLFFLDNVDSFEFATIWKKVSSVLDKTAFIVISKSGSTIEILWNYSQLEELATANHKKSLIQQSFFISELTANPLSDFARKHNRPLLEIPVKVGGRFSVLTPVGLVIAGLCGVNIEKMRSGANLALKDHRLITQYCDLFQKSFAREENISLLKLCWLKTARFVTVN